MKVNLEIEREMGKEKCNLLMEMFMLENGLMEKKKDKENMFLLMGMIIKEVLKKGKKVVQVFINGKKVIIMLANGKMI